MPSFMPPSETIASAPLFQQTSLNPREFTYRRSPHLFQPLLHTTTYGDDDSPSTAHLAPRDEALGLRSWPMMPRSTPQTPDVR